MNFRNLLLLCSCVLCSFDAYTQEPLRLPRLNGKIVFDGIPDDVAWKEIEPFKLLMFMPDNGGEPTEISELKVAYDDTYLYLSGAMKYSDPSMIKGVSKKRDYMSSATDWMGIIIDSFNDKRNALAFMTNPNGVRTDATVKNDYTSDSDVSFDWNTFWDVMTVIRNDEWLTEVRIPFSSLRFQIKDGKTSMSIMVFRWIAGKSEFQSFPFLPMVNGGAFWKPSLYRPVIIENLKPHYPVYISPYVTAGYNQTNEYLGSEEGWKLNSDPKYDAGLDLKASLSSNVTLDVTVNTDFAQVEADDQKINLTRFSLFFPEKRVFFLEKSDVFDFSLQEGNNLFYSRRIGIYDEKLVRIFGGVRLTGRINDWDFGFLDMQTAAITEKPSENFGVARFRKTILNQNSYAGAIFTSRIGMNGGYNITYGTDAEIRVKGDNYATVKIAQSFVNDSSKHIFDKAPTRILLRLDRRNQIGFSYDLIYSYSGKSFDPGIGFEIKDDYQGISPLFQYGWMPGSESKIRTHLVSLQGYRYRNTVTGKHESTSMDLRWRVDAKKGWTGLIFGSFSHEDLSDTLALGEEQAFIPEGGYTFASINAAYNTSTEKNISGQFSAGTGSFYGGWKTSISAAPMMILGNGSEIMLTYNIDYVTNLKGNTGFVNHIAGFKTLVSFTRKLSIAAFVQYNSSIDKILANIRLRLNPSEGNDLYLVYNEGQNTHLTRETPQLPHCYGRTVLLKYTYTFRTIKD